MVLETFIMFCLMLCDPLRADSVYLARSVPAVMTGGLEPWPGLLLTPPTLPLFYPAGVGGLTVNRDVLTVELGVSRDICSSTIGVCLFCYSNIEAKGRL